MEELPPKPASAKLEKNERDFLNKLLDFTYQFHEPQAIKASLQQLHDEEYCNGKKTLTIKQTEFLLAHLEGLYEKMTSALYTSEVCLAHIFVDFIHSAQMLMVYLSPEEGLHAVQERIPYILDQLSICYFYIYRENPSEAFLDQLDKIIYHAICFNFQADVVLKRDADFKLEKAHRLQVHYGCNTFLTYKKEIYAHEIYGLTFIGIDKKEQCIIALDKHHAELQKTYLAQTRIKPYTNRESRTRVTYRGSGILMLFLGLYLYFAGWRIPAALLSLAGGYALFFPLDRLARRGFTPEHEKTYSQKAMKNLYTLENTPGFKLAAQKIRAQLNTAEDELKKIAQEEKKGRRYSTEKKESVFNQKFSALLEANHLFLTLNFGLRKIKSKTPKQPVAVLPEDVAAEIAEHVEDIAIIFSSFPDNPDSDAYDTRHINSAYRPRQNRGASPKNEALQSSHAKVSEVLFTLPPQLQRSACVVIEGSSKMVFDLSIHIGELSAENQQKFLTGQYHVVAKRGQFGGFKHLKSGEYELKLPSSNLTQNKKLRFFFEQDGHKEIKSNDSAIHKVPYYRVTGTGGK